MFLFLDHYKGLARYIDLLRRGGALHKAESFIELVIIIILFFINLLLLLLFRQNFRLLTQIMSQG